MRNPECNDLLKLIGVISLFQWRLVARLMMWIYHQNLPWRQVPVLFLLLGILMGGATAVLLNLG
jgi:hypothetical protein